jgi:protein-S-isoprenylcysteine O-methyltransferase Ste14
MSFLTLLTIILVAIWCISELGISIISIINRLRGYSKSADRNSYFIVWFSTIPPIIFEYLVRIHPELINGVGDYSSIQPIIGYLGCIVLGLGITIRVIAVTTLRKQFTTKVTISDNQKMVDTGIYGIIRHPAYLGHLLSLLGIGIILGNWIGLLLLIILPFAGIYYRITVEERALLLHFGLAYNTYIGRTKKLIPGIW